MAIKKRKGPPETIAECQVGDVVRTKCARLLVTARINDAVFVRLFDGENEMSDIFLPRQTMPVLELVGDQSRYLGRVREQDDVEVDPLRGETDGNEEAGGVLAGEAHGR